MKVILDTNVLISSFMFKGSAARVHDFCLARTKVFISDFILDELFRNLREKFKLTPRELTTIRDYLATTIKVVNPTGKVPEVCRDKDDNNVLHLAKAVKADLIITGDKDLLILQAFGKTQILSPKDFIIHFISQK